MPSNWNTTTLDQLGRIVTGKTPSTKIEANFGDEYPFVSPRDMTGSKFIGDTERFLSEQGAQTVKSSIVPENSVVVSCIGSDMGKAAILQRQSVTNQQINTLVVDSAHDHRFVYYNLRARKDEIRSMAGGSAQPILNKSDFGKLSIVLPSRAEQSSIADVLSSLDDKIELNRQMNETLEEMAQTLFKSWFVDFDPVIDNALAAGNAIPEPLQKRAEARQALGDQRKPLPADIQALFPDRFAFTDEMGWIPDGWDDGKLGSLLEQRVERVSPSDYTRSVPYVPIDCISPKSLFLNYSKHGEEAQSSLTKFYENDILFGAMRPYFHKVCIAPFDGITRTTAFVLYPRKASDFAFALLALHQEKAIEFATAHSTGTTIPYAKWEKSLSEYSLVVPPAELRKLFNDKMKYTLLKIPTKYSENRVLSDLRDTLLPKLLSGELRIPDAEKQVAEAV